MTPSPKILQSLPGGMRFESGQATSVELCVSEWVSGSRFRDNTTIMAEPGVSPLIDVDIFRRKPVKALTSFDMAYTIRNLVKTHEFNLIVVQQHISTAARIAALNPTIPVVLQTHNFVEPRKGSGENWLKTKLRHWEFGRLAGITLISDTTLRQFGADWPDVSVPRRVVSNGLDFSAWTPKTPREKLILVIGRCHETKGILEAAQGVANFLRDTPDWQAQFILSEPQKFPDYFGSVVQSLASLGGRAKILTGIPFSKVQRLNESAAIAIVASKWVEPFGRTALEAHAGGAALISSGTGGLREISGDTAYYLDAVTGFAIEKALRSLAADEQLREGLAAAGSKRMRERFSLTSAPSCQLEACLSVCSQLDEFIEEIVCRRDKFLEAV